MTMIFIKRTFNVVDSSDIRSVGQDAGFIADSSASVIYEGGFVGFDVAEQLPDQTIEDGISTALASQLGVDSPVFAYTLDADHPDYASKRAELVALHEGTHPDQDVR
jgi:hypothetical protein